MSGKKLAWLNMRDQQYVVYYFDEGVAVIRNVGHDSVTNTV